jgi:hypothetical protein
MMLEPENDRYPIVLLSCCIRFPEEKKNAKQLDEESFGVEGL